MSWIPVIIAAVVGDALFGRTGGFYALVVIGFILKHLIVASRQNGPADAEVAQARIGSEGVATEESTNGADGAELSNQFPRAPGNATGAEVCNTELSCTQTPLPPNSGLRWGRIAGFSVVAVAIIGILIAFGATLPESHRQAVSEPPPSVRSKPTAPLPGYAQRNNIRAWSREGCLGRFLGMQEGQEPPPKAEALCSQQWSPKSVATSLGELGAILNNLSSNKRMPSPESLRKAYGTSTANLLLLQGIAPMAYFSSIEGNKGDLSDDLWNVLKEARSEANWSRILTTSDALPREIVLTEEPRVLLLAHLTPITLKTFAEDLYNQDRAERGLIPQLSLPVGFQHKGQIIDALDRIRLYTLSFMIEVEASDASAVADNIAAELGPNSKLAPVVQKMFEIIIDEDGQLSCAGSHNTIAMYCPDDHVIIVHQPPAQQKTTDRPQSQFGILMQPELWHEISHALYDPQEKSRVPFLAEAFATAEGEEWVVALGAGSAAYAKDKETAVADYTKFIKALSDGSKADPKVTNYPGGFIEQQPLTKMQTSFACDFRRHPPDAAYVIHELSLQAPSFYEQTDLARAYTVAWALAQHGLHGHQRTYGEKIDTSVLWHIADGILQNRQPTAEQKQKLAGVLMSISRINNAYMKMKKVHCT